MKFGAVILAAGFSSRMESFKPLLKIGSKEAIYHCTDLFRKCSIDQIVVVTGHREEHLRTRLNLINITCVFNPDYSHGMYSSICRGVMELRNTDGFFILPVDIPLIRTATINTLVSAYDSSPVIYPCFDNRRGHPPLISSQLIPEIISYDGEGGLKKFLRNYPGRDIPVWDSSILMDMDTKDDFTNLSQFYAQRAFGTKAEVMALASATMPPRGLAHGLAVAEIATTIGRTLNKAGGRFDLHLLFNSSLLHDIAKEQPDHEQAGAKLVSDLGLKGLAKCIRHHCDVVVPANGQLTEVEIVSLADKLIKGTHPVSVRQRFEDKIQSYAGDSSSCQEILQRMSIALQIQQLVEQQAEKSIDTILDRDATTF